MGPPGALFEGSAHSAASLAAALTGGGEVSELLVVELLPRVVVTFDSNNAPDVVVVHDGKRRTLTVVDDLNRTRVAHLVALLI